MPLFNNRITSFGFVHFSLVVVFCILIGDYLYRSSGEDLLESQICGSFRNHINN
jgi:hypothetical protein